ncbi:MAG TPA: peptidoglycan DD-metalloendopeptidase family protein [Bacteroidales bacterium]|nr:peptidoglycan DD-metalloendopeptidase family protein [Bacteroidales bacterium]
MTRNSKIRLSRILFAFVFTFIFSGTIPAFISDEYISVPKKYIVDDSSRVILYLDTTVLGPFYFPIEGKVISHFGKRGRRQHTGTDIKLAHGDTVHAAFSGVVTKASYFYGYGILVVLKHPGSLETYYAHLSKALVEPGDSVHYGTPVGLGGRTGRATTDHLHFEIRKKGKPLNSEHFFDFNKCNIKSLVLLKDGDDDEGKEEVAVAASDYESVTESKPVVEPKKKHASKKQYHTIKKGDTLFSLSRKYDTSVDDICKLNKIKKSGVLSIGQKVRVK